MAFGFKGSLYKLKLDRDGFLKEHERRARQLLRSAAREWILAAYVQVPVWSGMARGAFKFAKGRSGPSSGLFLSVYLRVLVPITQKDSVGAGLPTDGDALDTSRASKSPQMGGLKSRYTFSDSNGRYRFTFNTSIPHFEFNELTSGPVPPPSHTRPWKSFQAGKEAFDKYIEQHAKTTIPNLVSYLTKSAAPV